MPFCQNYAGYVLRKRAAGVFKNTGIGTGGWRALRLQIRYSSKNIQGAVAWMASGTRTTCGERQLELRQRWLEREC